jgi:hypothetical protein
MADQGFLTVFLRVLMRVLLAASWCTLIRTMNLLVQWLLKEFWRVVSVVVDPLSPVSHEELLHSNLLRIAC